MMNPEIAKGISAAYAELDAELSITQTTQLEHHCVAFLLVLQQDFLDWKRGIHPNVIWESRIPIIEAIFIATRARGWWKEVGVNYFTPEFQELVETLLVKEARDKGQYFAPKIFRTLEALVNMDRGRHGLLYVYQRLYNFLRFWVESS